MPAAGEWTITTCPKKGIGERVTELFGDDFGRFLSRAKALTRESSKTHHINVYAPARATDQQRREVREAGFDLSITR